MIRNSKKDFSYQNLVVKYIFNNSGCAKYAFHFSKFADDHAEVIAIKYNKIKFLES